MQSTGEQWAEPAGYPGYQVSSLGGFKNLRGEARYGDKPNRCGYIAVGVRVGGTTKGVLVHRLVASTFIPNPNGLPVVNHVNGIRHDNRVSNLEWATHQKNRNHRVVGSNIVRRGTPVIEIPLKGPVVQREWPSVAAAVRELGISRAGIVDCCKGCKPHFAGSVWKYASAADVEGEKWSLLEVDGAKYEVSSIGRVKTEFGTSTMGGLVGGYMKFRSHYVHRLVALAFLGVPPEGRPMVNHKDGNPQNNRAENLEWVSPNENAQHAHKTGLNPGRRLAVRGYSADDSFVEYVSMSEAARQVGVSCAQLSKVCDCPGLTAAGLRWRKVGHDEAPGPTADEIEAYVAALLQ